MCVQLSFVTYIAWGSTPSCRIALVISTTLALAHLGNSRHEVTLCGHGLVYSHQVLQVAGRSLDQTSDLFDGQTVIARAAGYMRTMRSGHAKCEACENQEATE